MGFDTLISTSQRLNASLEALAALGAELRLRRDDDAGDPRVRKLLREVVRQLGPNLLEGVDPDEQAVALAYITAFFRQALDLLENPGRRPGWFVDDPLVLQSQGQASRMVVHGIDALAKRLPPLQETLWQPGVFLDVGTGVGLLAIEAAQTWPALKVVGVDIWPPALELARQNLAASGVADRVELRHQDVQQLDESEVYSLAWLAGPFIRNEIAETVLERVYHALAPGGWLVFGLYAPQPNLLSEALINLRVVRGGGHPWTADEVLTLLKQLGLSGLDSFNPSPPIQFMIGRKH